MRSGHVSVAGSEASVWPHPGRAAQRGKRPAHVEDSQAVQPVAPRGPVHRVHGQDHREGAFHIHVLVTAGDLILRSMNINKERDLGSPF